MYCAISLAFSSRSRHCEKGGMKLLRHSFVLIVHILKGAESTSHMVIEKDERVIESNAPLSFEFQALSYRMS